VRLGRRRGVVLYLVLLHWRSASSQLGVILRAFPVFCLAALMAVRCS
jgi:hypothetical protein